MTTSIPQRNALQQRYLDAVVPALEKELQVANVHAVPKLTKIVLNVGLGKFKDDGKKIDAVVQSLARITGQKPVLTKAKKSISNFKIRKGMAVGAAVTLRGRRMYDFLQKLIEVTLPRTRDFQGLPFTSFDKVGNYTIAMREQTVFPEVTGEAAEQMHGLQITLCTTAQSPAASEALLRALGLPLKPR